MSWFYPDASTYLHSPLGQVVINDGRNYVRLSDKKYDIIAIDSPPPIWSAGAVVLLTQEFYQEAAQRLTPGGLLATYLPLQRPQMEKLVLRTFRSVFRYMSVVYDPLNRGGTYILGSQAPIALNPAAIQAVFGSPAARADLQGAPDFPARSTAQWVSIIRGSVWLTNNQVNAYTGAGPLLTDDHPLTEFFCSPGSARGCSHSGCSWSSPDCSACSSSVPQSTWHGGGGPGLRPDRRAAPARPSARRCLSRPDTRPRPRPGMRQD